MTVAAVTAGSSCNLLTGQIFSRLDIIHTKCYFIHIHMRTNIDIDDDLMEEAMRRSGAATKRAAVEEGLRLLIQTRRQGGLRKLRGKVHWQGDLDRSRTDDPSS